jgi:uncharacterized protein
MAGVPQNYVTATDELYIIEKVWPDTEVLASSQSEVDQASHPVFWTHRYGQAKVFGTTYGHSNETFQDATFLKIFASAVLWTTSD